MKLLKKIQSVSGPLAQQVAVVSIVMSEALRFKRIDLFLLLDDWKASVLCNKFSSKSKKHLLLINRSRPRVNVWST